MMGKVAGAVERRPYLILLCVLLVSIFMAYGITKLSMTTEFREFLPGDSPAVKTTVEFENKFGSATEIILLKSENVVKAGIVRDILELENSIRSEPSLQGYIAEVKSYVNYLGFTENILLSPDSQLEAYVQSMLAQPQVASAVDRLISDDQKATLITVSTVFGLSRDERTRKTDAFLEFVTRFDENNEKLTLEVTGDLTLHNEIFGLMGRDNQILIPAAAIFVVVILFLVFRRISDIGLPLLTVALGAVWALGRWRGWS